MDGLELRTASTEMNIWTYREATRHGKIGNDAICLVAIARVSQSTYLNLREAAQTTLALGLVL